MNKHAVVLGVVVLCLSACGTTEPAPPPTVPPITISPPARPTPSEPTQEQLSAQAEQVYRTFFAEWKRLELAGGATEPTLILLDNGAGKYLDGVMLFLREQHDTEYVVEGELPTTRVTPRPGESFEDSDPRLTLAVCEDSSESWHIDATGRHQGETLQGTAFLRIIDGRMKVIWASTEVVDSCVF